MRRGRRLALVTILAVSALAAVLKTNEWLLPTWHPVSLQQTRTEDGLTFLKLSLKRGTEEVACSLVRFHEADFELVVIDNGPSRSAPRFQNLAEALHQSHCLAGSNGGFFDVTTFEPNGLMIASGQSVGTFERRNWADGVLAVTNGRPVLAHRDEFELGGSVTQLIQAGPWLVRNASGQTGYTDDSAAFPRTFVATDGQGTWMLGRVSRSTLKDLSTMLCSRALKDILPVQNALNLDGGPSSGFWVQSGDKPVCYLEEATVVRNFVGIRKKVAPR